MILPTTYLPALLLLVLSVIAWGSWANTQKLAGRWRFELFYYDYAFGVALCAVVAAFTFGSMLPRELTFQDNLLIASKRQMLYAAAGGAVFNLANILLVAAISVCGMAVAFPIVLGMALVIGVVLNFGPGPQGNPVLVFGGALLVVIAMILGAFAYGAYQDSQVFASTAGARPKPQAPPSAARGIVLSVMSGILMGLFYPLVETSREGDSGVAAYGVALLFGAGVLLTTLLYVPFFSNFPVQGDPIELSSYFKGTKKQHFLGLLGGVIWMTGAISSLAAASAPAAVQIGSAASYALGQGAPLLSVLWGLLAWREFKGANGRVKVLLAGMIVLFAAGVAMISIARSGP